MTKNLVLIGYRGAGKSTVARLAAARLGRVFIDTDVLIEQRTGRTVADLFTAEGEARFREWEREAVALAAAERNAVIAVGGGAVMDERNSAALGATGVFVYLQCSADELARRLEQAPRPRLTSLPLREELAFTLAQREPVYRRLASHTIDTQRLSAQQAADAVVQWAQNYFGFSSR